MLKIQDLHVKVDGRDILKGVSLEFKKGTTYALLGPNASGKSTLVRTIMGLPEYQVTQGRIIFKGEEITDLPIEERSKLGLALAFQSPPAIKGVSLAKLLKTISKRDINQDVLGVDSILQRDVNVNYSGGEEKLSELIQIFALAPKFAFFDEIDSGLDLDRLEHLASSIKDKLLSNGVTTLFITHRGNIFNFIDPDVTHVMLDGEVVCSSQDWKKVWNVIKGSGYEKCRECQGTLLSD